MVAIDGRVVTSASKVAQRLYCPRTPRQVRLESGYKPRVEGFALVGLVHFDFDFGRNRNEPA